MGALEVDREFELELESELKLACDAVLLVASGAAPRVVVANLRHGRVVADPARRYAAELGISLGTLPAVDPSRVDLVVLASGATGVEAA